MLIRRLDMIVIELNVNFYLEKKKKTRDNELIVHNSRPNVAVRLLTGRPSARFVLNERGQSYLGKQPTGEKRTRIPFSLPIISIFYRSSSSAGTTLRSVNDFLKCAHATMSPQRQWCYNIFY